jgi:hypothetical protein
MINIKEPEPHFVISAPRLSAPAPQHCFVDFCTDDYTIRPADRIGLGLHVCQLFCSCLATLRCALTCCGSLSAWVLITRRLNIHSVDYSTVRMIVPLSQLIGFHVCQLFVFLLWSKSLKRFSGFELKLRTSSILPNQFLILTQAFAESGGGFRSKDLA